MHDDFDRTLPPDLRLEPTLPPDLVAMDAALAELALAEARTASPGLEDRLMVATQTLLQGDAQCRGAARELETLAAAERAEAGVAFEQRIFMATRAYLGRRDGAERQRRVPTVVVARRWAALAAALAVVALTITALVSSRSEAPKPEVLAEGAPANVTAPPVEIALSDESELAQLVHVVWSPPVDDGLSELLRDVDLLAGNVRGDWFQFTALADEESM